MASLFKDTRTGVYVVEVSDRTRRPRGKRVSTSVRDARAAERLRRSWEAAYAEGRYDPWIDAAPLPGAATRSRSAVTLAQARDRFLDSRAHRAANYTRVTAGLSGLPWLGRELCTRAGARSSCRLTPQRSA